MVWLLSPTYRRHLGDNVRLAYPEAEARRIILGTILEAGRTVFELPRLWLGPRRPADYVKHVEGWHLVEKACSEGKGMLFLSGHLGCFELPAHHCARHFPVTFLFRPPRQSWLGPLMETGRGGPNMEQAPADLSGVRLMMRALKKKGAVCLLSDQAPSAGEGRWLDYFGRPAYTMTLAARLSEMNVAVFFVLVRRLPWGAGYDIIYREPMEALSGDTVQRAQQINHEIESLIRQNPTQYLWGYNRYKRPKGAEPPPGMEN